MRSFNGNAVAIALARYVRDFVSRPAHGVVVIHVGTDEGALLGAYGKPSRRRRAEVELALYESLLAQARVDVVGLGLGPREEAWAVVVRAGRLVRPLTELLTDLLHRRVVGPGISDRRGDRKLAGQRVREWCDWWCSLSG
jgi:hypothetical protein